MLDQNTDRMWYVIGAVIVGAAIILIMNSVFPSLFGSIGETFQDKTEDVSKNVNDLTLTDGIGPITSPLLTADNISVESGSTATNGASLDFVKGKSLSEIGLTVKNSLSPNSYTGGIVLRQSNVKFKPNTSYMIQFDYQKTAGSLLTFGGHIDEGISNRTKTVTTVDGVLRPKDFMNYNSMYVGDDTTKHTVKIEFTTGTSPGESDALWIQPNRGRATDVTVTLFNLRMLEVK